jgi:SAM-dependent methyltransferase
MDTFAARAADWDQPSKIEMTNRFVEELKSNLNLQSDWRVLELGSGTGLAGLQLLPHIGSLVAEDTSSAMLAVLKGKLNGNEPISFVEGEIFDYQNCDIDLLISVMAFHHLPSIEKAIGHISTIIKPGGYVVIGDLMPEDGSFHRFEPIPHTGFEPAVLNLQFEQAGFQVITNYVYNTLTRERTPGILTDYDQFILVSKRKAE